MTPALWSSLIPLLVPLVIAAAKALVPQVPRWTLPILAPVLGAVAEIAGYYAGLTTGNPLLGAILGAAGVGLREIVDQLKRLAGASA
jgi:hypothetical protein